jgi:hypothetical protein
LNMKNCPKFGKIRYVLIWYGTLGFGPRIGNTDPDQGERHVSKEVLLSLTL